MRVVSQVGWLAILVAFVSLFVRLLSFFFVCICHSSTFLRYNLLCCPFYFALFSPFLSAGLFFIYFYVRGIIRILISQTLGLFML